MKKLLWILALAVFLSACGDGAKEVSQVSEDKAKDGGKASDEDKKDESG